MSTNANSKMKVLPGGWRIEPLHSKCPECGCDLTQLPADFKVLPDTFDELIRMKRRKRTRMEKLVSIAFKKLALRIKRLGQR
jgi:hypothetical protein